MPRSSKVTVEVPAPAQSEALAHAKPVRITLATKDEAEKATAALSARFKGLTKTWWEIGLATKDALDRRVPAALSMNAHDWMKAVFGDVASVAKIQRGLRIVRALRDIPMELVSLLTEGKAYLLTQVKPQDRSALLDQAIVVTNEQFEEIVEERRREYGIQPAEERVQISVTVAKGIASQWEEAEKKIARLAELDIELRPGLRGEVFEIIAALINTTPDEVLVADVMGGEPSV